MLEVSQTFEHEKGSPRPQTRNPYPEFAYFLDLLKQCIFNMKDLFAMTNHDKLMSEFAPGRDLTLVELGKLT